MIDKNKITQLVKETLGNTQNLNNIVDIEEAITVETPVEDLKAAIQGITEIFVHELNEVHLHDCNNELSKSTIGSKTVPLEFSKWVHERYNSCMDAFVKVMTSHHDSEVQSLTYKSFIQLLSTMSRSLSDDKVIRIPQASVQTLVEALLTNESLIPLFEEDSGYDDLRYVVLKTLMTSISSLAKDTKNLPSFLKSCFDLLKMLAEGMPEEGSNDHLESSFVYGDDNGECELEAMKISPLLNPTQHRKMFGTVWQEFFKLPLSQAMHKHILVILHTHLIPNFIQPRLLADFLIRSYQQGGGIAVLALQGLFTLMAEHNLEYPDFYRNLYGMLHPRVMEAKYRVRFFNLLDTFLSSSHIPHYIVAAFIKKLSHLTLTSPPHGCHVLVKLVTNLLKRHPSCQYLVHNQDNDVTMLDTFDEKQLDPAKCNVKGSSLWEIQTLKHHYLPSVVKLAAAFKKPKTNSREADFSQDLSRDYSHLFNDVLAENTDKCPMNHVAGDALFGGFEDFSQKLWNTGTA